MVSTEWLRVVIRVVVQEARSNYLAQWLSRGDHILLCSRRLKVRLPAWDTNMLPVATLLGSS